MLAIDSGNRSNPQFRGPSTGPAAKGGVQQIHAIAAEEKLAVEQEARHPEDARRDGVVGRTKEMFISGGFNIYPREVEIAIEGHPDVGLVAVLGVPDETFGEVGHAFVKPKPGRTPDAAALHDWCRERLANYKTPKRFEIRTELPRLPIGKIDKQALKQELAERGG